ncbi:tRNA cyclic N6-threonylcarbamoyladenosine(37) synthase TcdA [Psychrobium sp. 1_MG-2023]|uniref:tRNA cyclic N6-threonylcarbamoyladenosine(37) synthase TcdA n=1 Tax=Psychrobium sp. 1_MG-2023 TaxID=3062624 RepID=UPI000C3434F7|nr:tRNA cyclic N6-threonylcarbamoyladenosine(37) synthase TcdA [Psychrobium sp. 1_MG-2023]MDP2559679.1 tRNA cyclic N6-threonylcarbamoyladenosine(37) synthase TcdA [Psychrobium sp. 1_MG-2023]PKF59510.1 tRNA cyclic N6-threonylcarbamoyladenosine(37) synthase TcdA [Alteromonadales bacterium alter-6D02]
MSSQFDLRFGGTKRLYGEDAVEKLANAHVCVIGIGGVGSWAAEALARSAVGEITLIDLDDICVTNINRQIHALSDTVGQSKVEVMAQRIRAINPDCKINEVEDFVDPDNLSELITKDFDYVIDAIDSIRAKVALIAYCKRNKIKIITVGGAGGQQDPTQVQVTDLAKTYQDPLAAKVRNELRRHHNFSKNVKRRFQIECVFSSEQLVYPKSDGTVCAQKSQADGPMKMDCASGFGAATVVTASFGFVAAARVINKLTQ